MPDDVRKLGGGWYEVNGEKVRGHAHAMAVVARNANGHGPADRLLARNSSETMERYRFARRAGIQYDGDRDVYKVAGYARDPQWDDYWGYYDRHAIAARIVDLAPRATWRKPPDIVEPDNEEDTEFTEAAEELAKRLKLWTRLERVDRLGRIGQYGVLLIGAGDGQDMSRPLGRASVTDGSAVAYFAQYTEKEAVIDTYVSDRREERFGLPEMYEIDLSRKNRRFEVAKQRVHWTRVIHVAEDPIRDDVHGRPVLRRVLNTIFNDEKVEAASAEAFWQLADKILQLNIDPTATNVDLDAVKTVMEELYHDLRKHFYLQGGELSWLGGDSPDPTGISHVLGQKLAAGSGIPFRILFGSERGELASSQDERAWLGSIADRQELFATPLVRELLDRLVEFGYLPRPAAEDYELQWPNMYEASEQEIADRNQKVALTASTLTPVGGDPLEMVEIDDDRNVWLRPSEEIWKEREQAMKDAEALGMVPAPPPGMQQPAPDPALLPPGETPPAEDDEAEPPAAE